MAQDLPATVVAQIDAEESSPVNLLEIGLSGGTLRYSATKENVVFPTGGNTYTAKTMRFGNIQQTREGQIVRVQIVMDNVNGEMGTYNATEKFDGKRIVWKKVYRKNLSAATDYREMLSGYMEEPESIGKDWIVLNGVMGKPFGRRILQEYYQKSCNNRFGDSKCNKDGYANLASLTSSGTSDSGTTNSLTDNALTQADDYWNYGRIEVSVSGVTYRRRIIDFVASNDKLWLDVPMHTSIGSGAKYVVYKGCPLTWDACQAGSSYGPSSDNKANFNGWIHIGDERG